MEKTPQTRPRTALDLAIVATVKLTVSLFVLSLGFRAVSDDDFSRVECAQYWSFVPGFALPGSSWLPAPFWITGGVMMVLGRSLAVGQGVALALGLASALLVYASARLLLADRRAALLGALLGAGFLWGARLGV